SMPSPRTCAPRSCCASSRDFPTKRLPPPWIARWAPCARASFGRARRSTAGCARYLKVDWVVQRNWGRGSMNEELDSQLSAMFDDELPAAECELLARRLSRDEELKARWGRYAAIGATIRAEGGARLNTDLALRVSTAISVEPAVAAEPARPRSRLSAARWWAPVGGVAVAASVAAAGILLVRIETLPPAGPTGAP